MKKTPLFPLTILILVSMLMAGCSVPTPAPTALPTAILPSSTPLPPPTVEPVVVQDAAGRTVSFAEPPARIVIAGKATQLLVNAFYLFPEASERIVGIEKRSQTSHDFLSVVDPRADQKTILEQDAAAEQIIPLQPDLVVMKTYMAEKIGQPLEQIGVPVLYLDLETPDQIYRDIRIIGAVLGNSPRAEELVLAFQQQAEDIVSALNDLPEGDRPSTLLIQVSTKGGETAFKVPPVAWIQTSLVEMAGGMPVWKEAAAAGGWQVITLEQIAAWNPEFIFVVEYSGGAPAFLQGIKENPQWQALQAAQGGRLLAFPVDFLSWDQSDPRWTLGLAFIAKSLHPDIFAEMNLRTRVVDFYTQMYNLPANVIESQVLPLLANQIP